MASSSHSPHKETDKLLALKKRKYNDQTLSKPTDANQWIENNIKVFQSAGVEKQERELTSCHSYGEIHFEEQETYSKFIRIAYNSDPECVLKLLTEIWNIDFPKLALFFRNKINFLRSLDAENPFHRTRSTWLMTDGLQQVNESFFLDNCTRDQMQIGILPLDYLKTQANQIHAHLSIADDSSLLSPLCSAFLFIDDGLLVSKEEAVQHFWNTLALYLVESDLPTLAIFSDSSPIKDIFTMDPKVHKLLLKGQQNGPASALRIPQQFSLDIENLDSAIGDDVEIFNTEMHKQRLRIFSAGCSECEPVQDEDYSEVIKCINANKDTLHFSEEGDDLLFLMLKIFCQALVEEDKKYVLIGFSIIWDQIDIAKTYLYDYLKGQIHVESSEYFSLFMLCLAYQRVNFIEEYFQTHLNQLQISFNDIEVLYGFGFNDGKSQEILEPYFENGFKQTDDKTTERLGLFNAMTGRSSLVKSAVDMISVRNALNVLCKKIQKTEFFFPVVDDKTINPLNEVFLWAVVNGYHKIAMWLWDKSDNSFERVLIAEEIYHKCYRRSTKVNIVLLPQFYYQCYEEFRDLAVNFLEVSYDMNIEDSLKLLCKPSQVFEQGGGLQTTPLDIASSIRCPSFIGHQSVQRLLTEVWTGSMPYNIAFWQIFLSFIFPPYLLWVTFREDVTIRNYVREMGRHNRDYVDGTSTKTKPPSLSFGKKLLLFYTAPVTKFFINLATFIIFLVFVSIDAIENRTGAFDVDEWVTMVFFISFLTYEIRKVASVDMSAKRRIKKHFGDFWHIMDLFVFSSYAISITLRALHYDKNNFFMSITAFLSILRILKAFYGFSRLGPYIFMISRMFKEMMIFLVVLFVFMVSYGVGMTSVLLPQHVSSKTFKDVLLYPFLNALGNIDFTYDQKEANQTSFNTYKYNDYGEYVGWAFMIIYLLVANILLLNLLIAVFGSVYEEVKDDSKNVWSFQRFQIVEEYVRRSRIPNPFSFFSDMYHLILWMIGKCCSGRKRRSLTIGTAVMSVSKDTKELIFFERKVAQRVRKEYEASLSKEEQSLLLERMMKQIEELKKKLIQKIHHKK
uniref:Ion transport domain-containing protein n=1 Tax=Clytia hemisphaerica TaxID=252671 RepID=A0A7M5V598_9CNID